MRQAEAMQYGALSQMFLRKPTGVENDETFEIAPEERTIVGVHGMRPCGVI